MRASPYREPELPWEPQVGEEVVILDNCVTRWALHAGWVGKRGIYQGKNPSGYDAVRMHCGRVVYPHMREIGRVIRA